MERAAGAPRPSGTGLRGVAPSHRPAPLLASIFLVYLVETGLAVHQYSSGWAAIAGYLILVAFSACYVLVLVVRTQPGWGRGRGLVPGRQENSLEIWLVVGSMVLLYGVESVFARADAYVMCVYIVATVVPALGRRAIPLVVALIVVAAVLPALVPAWHAGINKTALITLPMVGLAMYAFFSLVVANRALAEARSEVAQLAVEGERNRIARDLHDLLGHSLTTITIKAGLARRLSASDPTRAAEEIGEVEEISRQALNDVRATLASYRRVTLTGELAAARELLRAAGISAELPAATDIVDPSHQELFGWAVREALTNVVRHAHASSCRVTLGPSSLEIVDDGIGGRAAGGHGLTGLRERVAAQGGSMVAGPAPAGGWRVAVRFGQGIPTETAPG